MDGIVYKGHLWPVWGGGVLYNSATYWHGGMEDISPTLRAEKNDAAVCVEDNNQNNNEMSKYLKIQNITLVRKIIPEGTSGGTGYSEYADLLVTYEGGNIDEEVRVSTYYASDNAIWEEFYKRVSTCENPEEAYYLLLLALGRDIKEAAFDELMGSFKAPKPIPQKKGKKIYRIRKLTSRECFRLMGVSDADIDKIKASGVSESQQYKMAGNSIVVQVLEGIFTQMFRQDSDALF